MAKFKGKNDNETTRRQLGNRIKYHTQAFKDTGEGTGEHASVTNFNFSERVYYGRIDLDDDPVIPIPNKLVPLGTQGPGAEMKMVLPFVKDMMSQFKTKIDQSILFGKIKETDQIFANLKYIKAYEDPMIKYNKHIVEIIDAFNVEYLTILKNSKEVLDFDNYLKHFFLFAKILGDEYPLTLTRFQKTQRSSIFSNAITISIADLDCSNDEDKAVAIIENSSFNFYLNVAKQYGFAVTKNAPWILVADLGSAYTTTYLKKYGLSSTREIFRNYYTKTYTLDLNILVKALQRGFNAFVNSRTFERTFITHKNRIKIKRQFRSYINDNTLINNYNYEYWIPLYIDIRNYEEQYPYNEAEITRVKEKAISFQKFLGNKRSLRYINEQFRIKHKFAEGGIPYYAKRFKKRKE